MMTAMPILLALGLYYAGSKLYRVLVTGEKWVADEEDRENWHCVLFFIGWVALLVIIGVTSD